MKSSMTPMLSRLTNAVVGINWQTELSNNFNHSLFKNMVSLFSKKNVYEQKQLCENYEWLCSARASLELRQLNGKQVRDRYYSLERYRLSQEFSECSAAYQLFNTKYILLSKLILIISYRHNMTQQELSNLTVFDLSLINDQAILKVPRNLYRPILDLEKPYFRDLNSWYRLRKYEETQECLFSEILSDGSLSPKPLTESYDAISQFIFLLV